MGKLKEKFLHIEEVAREMADEMAQNSWDEIDDVIHNERQNLEEKFHCTFLDLLDEHEIDEEDFEEFVGEDWTMILDGRYVMHMGVSELNQDEFDLIMRDIRDDIHSQACYIWDGLSDFLNDRKNDLVEDMEESMRAYLASHGIGPDEYEEFCSQDIRDVVLDEIESAWPTIR